MAKRSYVVAYRHPSDFGGMGVAADIFIPWLKAAVSEVEEVSLTAPGRPLSAVGKFAPGSLPYAVGLLLATFRRLIFNCPSLCYFPIAQSGPALVRDTAIIFLHRVSGVPCLVHLHGSLLQRRLTRRIQGLLLRRLLPRETWIVLSPEIAQLFPPKWKTVVIVNPLPPSVRPRPAHRRQPSMPLRVGWLGLIRPEKGVDLLIAACNKLPEVELTLAGEWGDLPRETRGAKYVGQLQRPEALRFWAGEDVFVLPSRVREGLPLAVLEALEAGVIVGATASPGLRALVECGAVRELNPSSESIVAFLEPLRELNLMEQELQAQQAAWLAIRKEFEPDRVRAQFQSAVRSLLA